MYCHVAILARAGGPIFGSAKASTAQSPSLLVPRLPEFIIEFTTMEPTKEQMSKMTQIGDLCVWAGLSAETPDGEGMVSPRVAFLNALDFRCLKVKKMEKERM